ncbi:dimethylallyl tryptophan synthase GliD1 [Aaosphaeria arxii CBS 175.79]|uniref:Dimethylallyl tryptophan synthase GliD1 n=1 Tax=Aaosphaeria arxii CBS 175.79 TaxID=1450172 RepID=A0A6A5XUQ8_9PLEO|nr:dimethylallyl tryptophan synthase GliD1 [Aaosphaeria arxii CBS 175.79]KAF2017048.1 dimethylallyl tryptophan synthase GliD1 [Aaosphaeria arxii CBS 175.79]
MTEAWKALSHCLPKLNANDEAWWQLTGQHLASLVDAAGYSMEKQYEALLFHYHWTVPYMGQAPGLVAPENLKWKSLLGLDGTPIEYSWKWNTASPNSKPGIRYVVEPIGEYAGTEVDPMNQQASLDLLHRLKPILKGLDNTWAQHFFSTLFDHDNARIMKEAAAGGHLASTIHLAVEYNDKGTAVKTYFFPRKLEQGGLMPMSDWKSSVDALEFEPKDQSSPAPAVFQTPARTALDNYLANNAYGKHLTPISMAIDNVAPEKSRLKWYFHTTQTSYASVRDTMTLGGLIKGAKVDALLDDLRTLVNVTNGVPEDFPEDAEVPAGSELEVTCDFGDLTSVLRGYLYYFDIAPGKETPEVKIFVPTRYYGRDDLTLARSLTKWMEKNGRGAHCERYMSMLEGLAGHRDLKDGKGLQSYVSCLFKKGELDVTTYLGAEAFHEGRTAPKQTPKRRGTLKRDEWY